MIRITLDTRADNF